MDSSRLTWLQRVPKQGLVTSNVKRAESTLSRQERRDLDIEIRFMEGLIRRDPAYVEALQILAEDYTRRGKFKRGRVVDEQLVSLRPSDPQSHYNLACSLSLCGDYENAARAIEMAIQMGFRDFRWLARDPDLRPLRRSKHYRPIREKVREAMRQGAPE